MVEGIIKFALAVGRLKKTIRTGWKFRGVKEPESVAEHSFRTAILAMLLARLADRDAGRLVKMALLHDLEEAITGDIMTFEKRGMNKGALLGKQEAALKEILSGLPAGEREEYLKLWKESEERKTADARFLKQVDLLEMMIQALEYEMETGDRKMLQSFWDEQDMTITEPAVREIYLKLKGMRK